MNQDTPTPTPEFYPDEVLDEPYVQLVSTEEFVEAIEKDSQEKDG